MTLKLTKREAERVVRDICVKVARTDGEGAEHAFVGVPKGGILYVKMLSPYDGLERTSWEVRLSPSVDPSTGWDEAERIGQGRNLPGILAPFVEGVTKEANNISVECEDGTPVLISKYQLGKLYAMSEGADAPKRVSVSLVDVESGEISSVFAIIILGSNGLELRVPKDRNSYSVILVDELLDIAKGLFNE